MATILETIFQHNLWANLRLLDVCAGLGEEQLDASAPGTFGSVRDTLMHLFGSEEQYAEILGVSRPQPALTTANGFPGTAALRAHAERSGKALIALAAEAPNDRVLRGTWGDSPYEMSAAIPLAQVIYHAGVHRVHICTILGSLGVPLPEFDVWDYDDEMNAKPETN